MRRLVFLAMVWCVAASAWGAVTRVYAFGDSYTDIGRCYLNTDGLTAIAVVAKKLGLEMVASNARDLKGKSLDFACSAASTGSDPGVARGNAWFAFGMKNQVEEFRGLLKAGKTTFDPKTTVFFLAGGLNDYRLSTDVVKANLESEISDLYALGARRFLVAVLPVKIPNFAPPSMKFNPMLRGIPAEMNAKLPGVDVELSGWGEFMDDVMVNAAKYGITNTTDKCAGREPLGEDPTPCAAPETHFFYHVNHPSAAVNKVVGEKMYEELMGK